MFKKKNTWQIKNWYQRDYAVVEITDHLPNKFNASELFIDFLIALPREKYPISISQSFAPSTMLEAEYQLIIPQLKALNPDDLLVTKDFDPNSHITSEKDDYVVHLLTSEFSRDLLEMLRFGGTTLANIMYFLIGDIDDWKLQILQSNKAFTRWFWLETPDVTIDELISKFSTIIWTADGHLNLIAKNLEQLYDYNKILQKIAEDNRLILSISGEMWKW